MLKKKNERLSPRYSGLKYGVRKKKEWKIWKGE